MLQAKFQDIGHLVLKKKIIKGFNNLDHLTWTIYTNSRSPVLWMIHMKFGLDWPSVFENIFQKWFTTDDDDGLTIEAIVSLKLTSEASAQVS